MQNSEILLMDLKEKLTGNKSKIISYRLGLFDEGLTVKPWKANELEFYDNIIEQCTRLQDFVSTTLAKIWLTHKDLKFFNADIIHAFFL